MDASVEVIRDGSSVEVIPIPPGSSIIFGRSPKCQVTIDDPSLSRRHMMLLNNEKGLQVKDMRSSNGTFVNGVQVATQDLKDGDLISLGYVILRVQSTAGLPAPPPRHCTGCGVVLPGADDGPECDTCVNARSSSNWVDQYELLRLLGEGTRGWVYLARNAATGENCALKVLKIPRMRDQDAAAYVPQLQSRFAIAAQGAVAVSEVGAWDGLIFVASEFFEKGCLATCLEARGKLPERQAICAMIDVLPALIEAESKGLMHGAIHSRNLMVDQQGWFSLGDFGQAPICQQFLPQSFLPTPYTAPEQKDQGVFGSACDCFSLGVTAYVAVSGIEAPPADSAQLAQACSPQLAYVIQRATHNDANLRYRSAKEMLDNIFMLFPGSEGRLGARQVG